jgi:hypothetical protein
VNRLGSRVEQEDQIVAAHQVPVLRIHYCPATGGDDLAGATARTFQLATLQRPKGGFARLVENRVDRLALAPHNLRIDINQAPAEALGESAGDNGLPRATEADEHDVPAESPTRILRTRRLWRL